MSGRLTQTLGFAGLLLVLSGCASYSAQIQSVEAELAAQRPGTAMELLDKQGHGKKDEVLFLLNKGMLLRMQGKLAQSNNVLELAKQRMKQLHAISIREQATSFVINDATMSYVGEEYEQVLLYAYKALNYLELGKLDEARVEVMQMDVRIKELGKSAAKIEAFGRYIAGTVFEARRQWNDAMVAYRKAYRAFRRPASPPRSVPYSLQLALLRIAQRQGLSNEVNGFKREFGISDWPSVSERRKQAELVLVVNGSLAPKKRERSLMQRDRRSGHIVRISMPYYPVTRPPLMRIRVRVGEKEVRAEPFEDIGRVARQTLDSKKGVILARAIARAVVKAKIAQKAREESRKKDRPLLGFLTEVATFVSERADTRSWTTLPYNIYIARVAIAPGTYAVETEIHGPLQHRVSFDKVALKAGETRFISYHWIPPGTHLRR